MRLASQPGRVRLRASLAGMGPQSRGFPSVAYHGRVHGREGTRGGGGLVAAPCQSGHGSFQSGTMAPARSPQETGMPLLDHFNPPLNRTHPWRSFHGAWAAAMARLLNQGVLPPGYYAVPLVDRDGPVEIDVAALREQDAAGPAGGAPVPQTWAPPAPGLTVAVELPAVDGVEVQVF